jgi:plastocyanin domain-containing protein
MSITVSDAIVLIGAVLSIVAVNWYFLGRRTAVRAAAAGADGVQNIAVTVHGGYSPGVIEVERGRPVRMTFDRQEDSSCSEEIVLPAFGIRRFLPAFKQTAIEFTPTAPGDIEFTCGMSMLRGTIRVR